VIGAAGASRAGVEGRVMEPESEVGQAECRGQEAWVGLEGAALIVERVLEGAGTDAVPEGQGVGALPRRPPDFREREEMPGHRPVR
jgi:hypothetical protein